MVSGTSDAFLSGEGIPVAIEDVDEELSKLWGPAAEREGGPDQEHPTVTRLALANLVLADLDSDGVRTRNLLEQVARIYPSRMIVLRRQQEAGRRVNAEISALCHLPAPGLPQVCAERIVLRAGADALELLPGAVRPLLETGLPLVLWWAGDARPEEALFRNLAAESARLILDHPDPEADPAALRTALDLELNRFGRDLAWFGITPWRELVAHFFDPPGAEQALDRLALVRVASVAATDTTRTPRVALWLVAWLAGQLGWKPKARLARGRELFGAVFDGPGGGIGVEFRTVREPDVGLPHLSGVTLDAGAAGTFELRRDDGSPEVSVATHAPSQPEEHPHLLRVPEWDDTRRLAAALESARDDPPYRSALPHLMWLLGND
jgi:hypothetical protein